MINKVQHFDSIASERDLWTKKNKYYYDELIRLLKFIIPAGSSVLELGCGTGKIIGAIEAERGVGVDFSEKMIEIAKEKHLDLNFVNMDMEELALDEKFDYIIISDTVGYLNDIQKAFEKLHHVSHPRTRIIITYHNFLWEPALKLGEFFGIKMKNFNHNWLSSGDIQNFLVLSGLEPFKSGQRLIFPKYIPILSTLLNKYLCKLPFIRRLSLVNYIIARPDPLNNKQDYSCSVIVPAMNESGNIERAVLETPEMGKGTEIIFIEGGSTDNTQEEIARVVKKYKKKHDLKWAVQDGKGKADAVMKGFDMATGDILMILDADLTVAPGELPKFYNAIASGNGEFINGCRLIYPMEKQAMRFLNLLGNKFFGAMFSWILDQRFKDTLCGTKVIFKDDYERLKKGRSYFGDFDPFGDFDLIFGASKLNLKIVEVPITYKSRTYGETNIHRWRHGWLLLRMTLLAMKKIKFI